MNTYKFYTKKGERLAAFLDDNTVTIYKCSLDDQFCRKAVRTAHHLRQPTITTKGVTETLHPEVITFDTPIDSKAFFTYLKARFYLKRYKTITKVVPDFYKDLTSPKVFTL